MNMMQRRVVIVVLVVLAVVSLYYGLELSTSLSTTVLGTGREPIPGATTMKAILTFVFPVLLAGWAGFVWFVKDLRRE